MVFSLNLEGENLIEFQNIASYILELLRIFNPDLKKRPRDTGAIGKADSPCLEKLAFPKGIS
ncbi:MAG: hypothetical protein A3C58_00385 [Candidatus Staskawiczbacteria bacterium RIFCSPHIGHO2_02_FULL_34_10]|uniref:Uncharacterized protein n=1 Tax=Candidatus Staskawiczbacteria bacterium RIFCSPHIGHO2_02_FULL_34_10 TaxID=1802205 RepID=A0A1G2HTT2_9BACT|nr:MAG: hypothetical protein A3C58_00385 [Candidatus Staskawiczbacteria bacterium RIFCSPHIGHO2_02_FULL_34_10]